VIDALFGRGGAPIGLDIGSSSIKMLQFSRRGGGELAAIASGQYALDPAAGETDRRAMIVQGIGQLLEASAFRGRQVVVGLSDDAVQYKNMRLPQMPPDERAEAIRWEADERFDLDDEAQIEYLDAGEVRQGEQVRDELILMAVRGTYLRPFMQMLADAGLRPVAIEPTPVALCRCLARAYRRESDRRELRVVAELGHRSSKVLVLRGSRVLFYKPIDIGAAALNAAVAEHLDLSGEDAAELRRKLGEGQDIDHQDGERLFGSTRRENVARAVYDSVRPIIVELATEIGLCLRYFSVTFRGKRPDTLGLLGGEASDANVRQIIAEQLELNTTELSPLEGIDLSSANVALDRRGGQASWAVAAGLALRQTGAAGRLRGAA
jgi:type IV pilus assembly protein PilM